MGIPENTLLTCAESLVALTRQGLSEAEAFERIEEHRSMSFPGTGLPHPLTLASYVQYRLRIENAPGPAIPVEHLALAADEAMRAARAAYGV